MKSKAQDVRRPELLCTNRVGRSYGVVQDEAADHIDGKARTKHVHQAPLSNVEFSQGWVGLRKKRIHPKAQQKHVVFTRDGVCCTFRDAAGKRCTNERWLHVHHIVPVSQGGSNDPSNLTTLCSYHHDLVHQLSFPLEEQVSWLRSPQRSYIKFISSPGLKPI